MSRILVLGGYGGFGGRICRRLRDAGHEVLVAGRSLAKARGFCAGDEGLIPLALDRDGDLALDRHRPDLLVDAAGPFQHSGLAIPESCIAAGVHYLDIADARDFVARIGTLDAAAREAGVAVISGASSVPALSGAVARRLAAGMDEVRAVEIAISASNRAAAGASVAAAILSYAGRPIRLWRGRTWLTGHGWHEPRRERFEVRGGAPLAGRRVALCEVPDLDLLPHRLPGRPAVVFRAGDDSRLHNLGLAAAARLVRLGLVSDLSWLKRAHRLTVGRGSDRSAMIVRLFGTVAGGRVERRWTLIADRGDGPEIPALAVPILAGRLLAGTIAPGATDAGALLDLADFEPAFAGLAIRHETLEIALPPPLYARAIGAAFDRLPPAVRAIHQVLRDDGAGGAATVTRGRNPIARLIGRIVGFPPAGEHELHVHFDERDGVETWTRRFSGKGFRSRLALRRGLLVERFGLLTFGFELPADENGLAMILRRWWLGPIPMPLLLGPRCAAREWEEDGRFRFEVSIRLPLIGLIAHYQGWLAPSPLPAVKGLSSCRT